MWRSYLAVDDENLVTDLVPSEMACCEEGTENEGVGE